MFDYSDLIGVPFVNRGRNVSTGLDCYGLAMEVFRRQGVELPEFWLSCEDASRINETVGTEKGSGRWTRLEQPEAPCLIVLRFNKFIWNHVGVYIGAGKMLHIAEKTGVRVERLDHPYWRQRTEGYYIPKQEVRHG